MNREIKFRAWHKTEKFLDDVIMINETHCYLKSKPKVYIGKSFLELMQYTGLKDKNGKEIYEGYIVEGKMWYCRGDGYKKKGYPDFIRKRLQVVTKPRYGMFFFLSEVGVHPDDAFAKNEYQYRQYGFSMRETRETNLDKDNKVIWHGCNRDLEVIGNIYENPDLLEQK